MSNARIQFSTADESKWTSINPNLREGELVFSKTSLGKYKAVVGAPGGSNYKDSILLWDEAAAEKLTADAQSAAATATQKATEAAQQAQAATAGGETATTKAAEAVNSANAAADSASAASGYASTATVKATAAANSASAAASSESNAAASANTAVQKATAAANSAETATAKATAAADSASAASDSAIIAGQKATAAANSAGAAAASATASDNSAAAAASSAEKVAALNYSSAAAHNAIFRGKYLGDHVTNEQWAAIKAGTFDDLYIGDYWTIGGVDYVIAAFNYYLNTCWSPTVTANHVTIVPRKNMYTHVMNDTNVTTGAYVGSKMYSSGLNSAKTTIANAFGSAHILTIRQLFQNGVTDNYETSQEWYDASVWLMSEFNVYGALVWKNAYAGTNWRCNYTIDNSQYPVFAYDKTMIHTHEDYWLRDVAYSGAFAFVRGNGDCDDGSASDAFGVRPAFNIYQS